MSDEIPQFVLDFAEKVKEIAIEHGYDGGPDSLAMPLIMQEMENYRTSSDYKPRVHQYQLIIDENGLKLAVDVGSVMFPLPVYYIRVDMEQNVTVERGVHSG